MREAPAVGPGDRHSLEAARQRLLNRRRDAEAEITEINTALEGLDTAARLIAGTAGKPGSFKSESAHDERAARTIANRHVTEYVRDYLAEWHKYDEKIDIGEIVAYLFRRGVKRKKRSLYSAVHVS